MGKTRLVTTVREDWINWHADLRRARVDRGHESRFMTYDAGYCMVRRPGCIPYVIAEKDWLALPLAIVAGDDADVR